MKYRLFTAAGSALAFTIVFAPAAHAEGGPVACSGVVAVSGGYQLTQDTSCQLNWTASNEFLDLRGHTFSGTIVTSGSHLTLRNGTFKAGPSYFGGDFGALEHVRVESMGSATGVLIEAGNNFTVDRSVFADVQAAAAVDFYFGNGGRVTNSTFSRTSGIAVSVQANNDVAIEHNRFIGNSIGVNLWPEDGFGVERATVSHNVFFGNTTAGVRVTGAGGLEGTRITHNTMTSNGGPGLAITLYCDESQTSCPAPHLDVSANRLIGNGAAATGVISHSGMFTRGYVAEGSNVASPQNLAGVTITGNRANHNADLGFDVVGATDGGGNRATHNGNPQQCLGVLCNHASA